MAILQDQAAINAKILAEIEALRQDNARLKANNEALRASKARAVSWKVSEKGAVSIYGLGRFPVTLYWSQLTKLDKVWGDVMAFATLAKENGELSSKDD